MTSALVSLTPRGNEIAPHVSGYMKLHCPPRRSFNCHCHLFVTPPSFLTTILKRVRTENLLNAETVSLTRRGLEHNRGVKFQRGFSYLRTVASDAEVTITPSTTACISCFRASNGIYRGPAFSVFNEGQRQWHNSHWRWPSTPGLCLLPTLPREVVSSSRSTQKLWRV